MSASTTGLSWSPSMTLRPLSDLITAVLAMVSQPIEPVTS